MQDKLKVSVVIPYYKGKKYIEQCILSVLNQPYPNIELILINDGSPDDGDTVCKALAEQDSRIRYFSKENEGIGATRNLGIRLATGDYIAFLDQDDIWCKNFLNENVVRKIADGGDIVGFSHYVTDQSFKKGKRLTVSEKTMMGGAEAASTVWNHHSSCIFRREFLIENQIGYALTRHEDVIFLQKAMYKAVSISLFDRMMFCYRNNPASETHRKINPEKLYIPILNSWMELLNWHEVNHSSDEQILRLTKNMICIYAMEAIEAMYLNGSRDEEVMRVVEKVFPNDILENFETIMYTEYRKQQWRDFFQNHDQFVLVQKRKRRKMKCLQALWAIPGVKKCYYLKKYPEVIPKELIS